jgi:hypothetical protein
MRLRRPATTTFRFNLFGSNSPPLAACSFGWARTTCLSGCASAASRAHRRPPESGRHLPTSCSRGMSPREPGQRVVRATPKCPGACSGVLYGFLERRSYERLLGPVNTKMAGWREEAQGRGPRRERGNVAAVLLDRASNAGTAPQQPSPFGLPFFGCRASLPNPVKTAEGIARLRRLAWQPNSWQHHPPFSVNRP